MITEKISKEEIEKREAEIKLLRTPWIELNAEQKIERMRERIKNDYRWLDKRISNLERELGQLIEHQHSKDGGVVIPYPRHYGGGVEALSEKRPEGKELF